MSVFRHEANTAANTARGDILIQTKRVAYTITSTDVSNGYTPATAVVWDTPFADGKYTVAQSVEDKTSGGAVTNDYSPGDVHDIAANGFNTCVYVGPGAVAGEKIVVHCIAIYD